MTEKNNFPDWEQVFNSIFDLVAFIKPDGTIFHCNQRFAQFVNRDLDSIIGQKCHSIVHGTDGFIENCPLVRSLKSGKRESWECREKERYFSIVVDPIRDSDGKINGFIHILRDITEQKIAEEALKESLEKYKYISELISDYVYAFNVTPEGELIGEWITDSFEKFFGFTKEEIDQRGGWKNIVYPEDLPVVLNHAKKVASGQTDIAEFRLITRRGEVRWLSDYAIPIFDNSTKKVIKIYGAAHDITERRKLLEDLRKSEEKYRTVVENAGEVILIAQDEMIKYANPKAIEISGYSIEELLSKPFIEFIHPEDRQMAFEYYRKLVNREINMKSNYPLRIIDKQGNIRWLEITAVPIEWEGKPAELNIIRDITDLKKQRKKKKIFTNNSYILKKWKQLVNFQQV